MSKSPRSPRKFTDLPAEVLVEEITKYLDTQSIQELSKINRQLQSLKPELKEKYLEKAREIETRIRSYGSGKFRGKGQKYINGLIASIRKDDKEAVEYLVGKLKKKTKAEINRVLMVVLTEASYGFAFQTPTSTKIIKQLIQLKAKYR